MVSFSAAWLAQVCHALQSHRRAGCVVVCILATHRALRRGNRDHRFPDRDYSKWQPLFLNWITIVPALACFDDRAWSKILPGVLARRAERAAQAAKASRPMQRIALAAAAIIALLSIQPLLNILSAHQIMNTSFDPLDLVNTYGAFGAVGKQRFNIVFEGTDSYFPDETATWKAYPYKGLPVALDQQPPQSRPINYIWIGKCGSRRWVRLTVSVDLESDLEIAA